MLESYAERYRRELTESVIPFWLRNSLDREYGGYFTCLDREGKVYDTKKYLWLQGREVWMFSRLYNRFERKEEYLDAARIGIEFIRRHGMDPQGRLYFCLTREGRPYFQQRKPYAGLFTMLALLEYSRATGDRGCLQEAKEMFLRVAEWIRDPSLLGRPAMEGQARASNLANVMALASMAIELAETDGDPKYREAMREAIGGVERHYDPLRRILLENVPLDPKVPCALEGWPEGRLFNPGHSIEVAWFLLRLLEFLPSAPHRKLALDAIEGTMEFGWDREFGGLYYMMDTEGRPTLQLESNMKLWWPHTEAIYALILAFQLTGETRYLGWLETVDRYAFAHFADAEFGEWFGYCDRRGELALTCKGGSYKGFFHVPRFLLMSIEAIEKDR